ncbi:MAG: acyl-ACP--UDP-N-acetylglucosamine O-acyltransferase [bacterium]
MIHNTAVIDQKAKISEGVEIGPYAIIEEAEINKGCIIGANAFIGQNTVLKENCQIYPHAVIGTPPQDLKYKGEKTYLRVGKGTVIREFANVNRGTTHTGETTIGDNVFIMAYSHVAHDCRIGNNVILANAATLAGHIIIEDYAIIGGLTAIHQFVRVGKYALVGGGSGIPKDILPYAKVSGNRANVYGINSIGLKRHDVDMDVIHEIKKFFKLFFHSGLNTTQALEKINVEVGQIEEVKYLIAFIKNSERGVLK